MKEEIDYLAKEYKKTKSEKYLNSIINNMNKPLTYFISKYVDSYDIIEELKTQTFIKIWQHIDSYNEEQRFIPWVFTIAKNVCLIYLRDNKKNIYLSSLENNSNDESSFAVEEYLYNKKDASTADLYVNTHFDFVSQGDVVIDELYNIIKAYVANEIKNRRVIYYPFYYNFFEKKTTLEISHMLNMSENSIKTWIRKCKQEINLYVKTKHKDIYNSYNGN
ncbi:MAG: sigma-70 family RNA polymerase sigma factor [Clostridia bacterium]